MKEGFKLKFGEIDIIEQQELTTMPQEAATAWYSTLGGDKPYCGATYKVIAYCGDQPVKGVNHIFIAQQTLILAKPERHIVLVYINEFGDTYNVVEIKRIL